MLDSSLIDLLQKHIAYTLLEGDSLNISTEHRSVFKTLTYIYDGASLLKSLTAFDRKLVS